MPEARDRLPGGGTADMAFGFGFDRGVSVAAAQRRNGHEEIMYQSPLYENKENIPPESSTSRRRRRTRPRKSPLPSWYPRTPLQDITAVVNALQRRRGRLRAAAELRRRHHQSAIASPFPLLTSPLAHELSASEQPPLPIPLTSPLAHELSASEQPPLPIPLTSPLAHELIASEQPPLPIPDHISSPSFTNSPQPAEHSLGSSSTDSHGKNTIVADESSNAIDEIGRIVMENFQKMAKRTTKKSKTSTLMSMR